MQITTRVHAIERPIVDDTVRNQAESRSRSSVTKTRMRSRPQYLHSHPTHVSLPTTTRHNRQDNEPALSPRRVIHDRKAMANSTPRNPVVIEIPVTVAALLAVAAGALSVPDFAPVRGALLLDTVAKELVLFGRAV